MYLFFFFFFNDTATTEIYTLSLHDALPICAKRTLGAANKPASQCGASRPRRRGDRISQRCCTCSQPVMALKRDRKSTRLNSSHSQISYAVFCLKKKKKQINNKSITIIITYN